MSWEDAIFPATRERCGVCQRPSPVGFHVPDEIWLRVVPDYYRQTVLCIMCYASFGDERMIAWDEGIEFYPVSLLDVLRARRIENAPERPAPKFCSECARIERSARALSGSLDAAHEIWEVLLGPNAQRVGTKDEQIDWIAETIRANFPDGGDAKEKPVTADETDIGDLFYEEFADIDPHDTQRMKDRLYEFYYRTLTPRMFWQRVFAALDEAGYEVVKWEPCRVLVGFDTNAEDAERELCGNKRPCEVHDEPE